MSPTYGIKKATCPRCAGTGVYEGFGVCFRCRGAGKVNAAPARKRKAARVAGTPAEEYARMVGKCGEADAKVFAARASVEIAAVAGVEYRPYIEGG